MYGNIIILYLIKAFHNKTLKKLRNNLVCFLVKAICGWWKVKLQVKVGCQIIKKKFSKFCHPLDDFFCYYTCPNNIKCSS